MARILDIILLTFLVAVLAAATLYKLKPWFRFRHDPTKLEALISSGQVYPEWLARFIFDGEAETDTTDVSPPNSGCK